MKQEVSKKRLALMFRILREVSDISQIRLAQDMDITQQSYSCLESGDSAPKLDTIIKFCSVLKIGAIHFFDHFLKENVPFTEVSAEQIFTISGVELIIGEYPGRAQRVMKMVRLLKKVKQEDVAKKFSIAKTTYCHIESNPGKVSNDTVKKFCNVVGIDFESTVEFIENTAEPLTWSNVYKLISSE